ncbi:MAG: xanthine dehydrogenase accessory protein XdhC [Alphaproteobacteria bacterium]
MLADWLKRVGGPAVLVTVVETKGSTPREPGARMLIEAQEQHGTIGGGELEWRAQQTARRTLREGRTRPELVAFALGPELGQCCGGFVRLLFEPLTEPGEIAELAARLDGLGGPAVFARRLGDGARGLVWQGGAVGALDAAQLRPWLEHPGPRIAQVEADDDTVVVERLPGPRPQIWVFGAGHVGRALVDVLARLPRQRVVWVDERDDAFPTELPAAVTKLWVRHPELVVPRALGGAAVVVMTHSHARDLAIVDAALGRGDLGFLGLIGSTTKRAKFEKRLHEAGHRAEDVARLVCPIGLEQIHGKEPEVIALSVAAQLLAHYDRDSRYG